MMIEAESIECRTRGVDSLLSYDDGTYLLLSDSGEVLAVSGNSEFDDIDKKPTNRGIIVHVLGEYLPETYNDMRSVAQEVVDSFSDEETKEAAIQGIVEKYKNNPKLIKRDRKHLKEMCQ